MKSLANFLLFITSVLLVSCNAAVGNSDAKTDDNWAPGRKTSIKVTAPTLLELADPASSPSDDTTPTIRVSGGSVSEGATVKIFFDSECTNEAASGLSVGEEIELRSSELTAEETYTFYANAELESVTSDCSEANVEYVLDLPPTPTLSYASSTGTTGTRGTAMTVTPSTLSAGTGATIINCTTATTLPTGVSLNSSTCEFSGTPTTLLNSTSYTVTVTNSFSESSTATVNLEVDEQWTDSSNATIGFGGASSVGAKWSSSNFILAADTDCDGNVSEGETTYVNCSELDSSWTPQWSSLVAYWKMNESSWSGAAGEILDAKNSNHGRSFNGANTTTTSKIGSRAGVFDGTNDYASATLDLSGTNKVTVAMWLKWNAYANDDDLAMEFSADTNTSTTGFLIDPNNTAGAGATFSIGHRGDAGYSSVYFTRPTAGIWHHYVFVFDKSLATNELAVYVNGKQQAVTFYNNNNNTNNFGNDTLYFMSRGGTTLLGQGSMDDVAIWTTALTESEALAIYQRQAPLYAGRLVSRVFDAKANNSWDGFSWLTGLPFGKELPGDINNSGTITGADSETSSNYSDLTSDTLMSGLVGLWHFNETAATGGGNNDFSDRSGSGNHGEQNGSLVFGDSGLLQRSPYFDGDDDYITMADSTSLSITGALTLSLWIKAGALNSDDGGLISKGSNGAAKYFGVDNDKVYELGIIDNILYFQISNGTTTSVASTNVASLLNGNWHHIAATWSGTSGANQMKIYINGTLTQQSASAITNIQDLNSVLDIGGYTTVWNFKGNIDEVAVWSRALDGDEISDVYRRGANQIHIQTRSCTSSNCSDNPAWLGPALVKTSTASPYQFFSEIHNNTVINSSGTPTGFIQTAFPDLLFTGFSGLSHTSNRYFQYRAFLDNYGSSSSTLCNYGSGATWCSPELKSFTVRP